MAVKEFLDRIGRGVLGWILIGLGVWAIGLTGFFVYRLLGRIFLGWFFPVLGILLMAGNVFLFCQKERHKGGPSGIPVIAALFLYLSATLFLFPQVDAAEQTYFLIGLSWLASFILGRGYTVVFLFGIALTALIFLGGIGGWRSLSSYLILAACFLLDLLIPPLTAALLAWIWPLKERSVP